MSVPELSQPIQIKPIINYPREAQTGQTYLMSIDVQLATPDASWPYPDEEYPITFILNTQPYFRYEPLNGEREPGIVLHRFGGTYGPAQYLLTASEQEVKPGHISITFLNGWGLPMTYLELECSVKAELAANKEQEITVLSKEKAPVAPQNQLAAEEKQPYEKLHSSHEAIEALQNSQEADEETYGSQETTEERTRRFELIAEQLKQTGWALYRFADQELVSYFSDRKREEGIAVAGHPNIPDGYMLFIARKLVGIIKTRAIGVPLTSGEATETLIATMESLLSISIIRTGYSTLPFFYGTTDGETLFTNYLEPESQSRSVFTFHRPETLARWLEQAPPNVPATQNNLLRSRLQRMPTLQRKGLREHQFEAISNLERSLAQNRRYTLLQLETGTGITFAGLNIIHRLLKYGGVRRILYALDTPIAKDYVIDVLQEFVSSEGGARLIDLYDIDYLSGNTPDTDAPICIATLEQFYRAFIADFFAHTSEKNSRTSPTFTVNAEYPEAGYSWTLPIEYFDVIVLANWDSHLHQTWQPFLDYFDAFIIGSTAVVDEQLISLFANNLVYRQEADLPHALILTSRPEEYKAVCAQMGSIEQEVNPDTVYGQSVFATEQGAWRVGLARIVGTPERVAFEADRVISNFNPRVVLLVGTAVGVQGMAPGAVVFATQVFSYDQGQEKPFILRTEVSGSSEALVERARLEARRREWLQRIPPHNSPSEATPRVFFGPIVDGSILPEFFTFSDLVHTTEILKSDMLAVDTTVESFLQALDRNPQVQFAIIRGIDGLLDENRPARWSQAAQYASAFAFELLAKLNPEDFAQKDEPEPGAFEILCLFSRKDMRLASQLTVHLKPLMEQGYITLNNIAIENFPFPDTRESINKARVILLFLSADFLFDDPFWNNGIPQIMQRFEAGELAVIPILLRPVLWDDTPFDRFVALPRDGSWIAQSSSRDRDKAYAEIAQEIESLIEKLTSPVPDEAKKIVASLREFLEQNNNKVLELETSLLQTDRIHPAIIARQLIDDLLKADLSLEKAWDAYWQIEPSLQVCGLDERRTTSDIVSLISYTRQREYDKFARLEPFRDIVNRRFNNWMTEKWWQESPIGERKPRFNEEQVRWLERIRDYIATDLRFEQRDFDRLPFSSDGGLATARNLFGSELPSILDELNITLVADLLQGKEFTS